jgi:hypothetical protein
MTAPNLPFSGEPVPTIGPSVNADGSPNLGTATANATFVAGQAGVTPPSSPGVNAVWDSLGIQYGQISADPADRIAAISGGQAFEGNCIQEINPYFDSVLGLWCAAYTAHYGNEVQGFATAPSPRGPWTKDATPFIGGGVGGEAGAVAHCNIYVEGTTVYFYYPTNAGSGGPLKQVTWQLGVHPQGNLTAPTTVFTSSGTASLGMANSSVLKVAAGQYELAFEFYTSNNAGHWNIGFATATSPAGPFTQVLAPAATLQRATGAMFGGPRLFLENGKRVLIYHAASIPGVAVLQPTDIYRAVLTGNAVSADTWVPEAAPLIERVATAEVDQVADFRMVTDAAGVRHCFFEQFDNALQVARVVTTYLTPQVLSWTGTEWRRRALQRSNATPRTSLLASLSFYTATDTTYAAIATTYTEVNVNSVFVTFVVPPSGIVTVEADALVLLATANSMFWNLRESSADLVNLGSQPPSAPTGKRVSFNSNSQLQERHFVKWVIGGLKPGTTHTYALGYARKDGAGASEIHVGPSWGTIDMAVFG